MCIGIPMQVVRCQWPWALCRRGEREARVDLRLLEPVPAGAWILVFLDTAREILSEQRARQIDDALQALERVLNGDGDIDPLFQDLVGREPWLPDHLRPQTENEQETIQS